MYIQDPLLISCDKCGTKNYYKLIKVRSLKASCLNCEYSFEQVGLNINRNYKELNDSYLIVQIILEIEDEFLIEFDDEEAEEILTIQNLLDKVSHKTDKSIEVISSKAMKIISGLGVDISQIENSQQLISELKYDIQS